MSKRPWAFRVRVYDTSYWFRVYIHRDQAQMHRYLVRVGAFHPAQVKEVAAVCGAPAAKREKGCLGELNFYYPFIGPGVAAHEFQHAVQVVLGVTGLPFGAPCKADVLTPRSKRTQRQQRKWNAMRGNPEVAANLIEMMMLDFQDECQKRDLWAK